MALIYKEQEVMLVHCSTLVIKVESVKLNYGSLKNFCNEFDLDGLTNGKLFVVYDMMEPSQYFYDLIKDVLMPLGMKYNNDHVILYEQITEGVQGHDDPEESLINKPIPLSEDAEWIGSIIKEEGQYIWLI